MRIVSWFVVPVAALPAHGSLRRQRHSVTAKTIAVSGGHLSCGLWFTTAACPQRHDSTAYANALAKLVGPDLLPNVVWVSSTNCCQRRIPASHRVRHVTDVRAILALLWRSVKPCSHRRLRVSATSDLGIGCGNPIAKTPWIAEGANPWDLEGRTPSRVWFCQRCSPLKRGNRREALR